MYLNAETLAKFAVVKDVNAGWTVEARVVQYLYNRTGGASSAAMMAIRFYGGSSAHTVKMIENRCTELLNAKILRIESSMSAVLYCLDSEFRKQCDALVEARDRLDKDGFIKPH